MAEYEDRDMMYRLAKHLVDEYYFQVLFVGDDSDEVWLEKRVGKKTQIIRFYGEGFDWKNYMKQDIAKVFQRVKAIRRLLANKLIEIHNVYVAANSPLDDWSILKQPMQLNENKPIIMYLYYLDKADFENELDRFAKTLHVGKLLENDGSSDGNEMHSDSIKQELQQALRQQAANEEKVFTFGKPIFTYLFLAINIIVFVLMELNGGSQQTANLIRFGAKENIHIIDGQWWRLLTSMFLHIGFLHLFMNMLVLYYLGTTVEKMYGSLRFFVIYILAGIGGAIASFAFNMNVSAGASGAIFGLFGALLCFGLYHRQIFLRTIGQNIIFLLLINLIYGFFVPGVDVQAHIGGLATGFLAAMITQMPGRVKAFHQASASMLVLVLISAFYLYGVQQTEHSAAYAWEQTNQLVKEQKYEAVVKKATEGLKNEPGEMKSLLLFNRGYAHSALQQTDQAIADYEASIQANPDIAESHYNLALLYLDRFETDKAKTAAKKAHELAPKNSDFKNLYERLKDK
ncbi:rhomboid family intramembrane serine protease [Virgibacillus sp. 179-BFC.A HS]|uniref:Rhomboid family intramembrane serine protease n=1 Tax=Tigheibacillus jepli TaxID=3035914 RepID=A0ABU5CH87_9BACI|nr:rhomboid family intramembrane serine protease [Virgibacillus sp. 179-BFC.A HS]MDY0405575.1 rhomboid family intramembrane serine protease [Virgibacillus sp. 179-BFC.A HS]